MEVAGVISEGLHRRRAKLSTMTSQHLRGRPTPTESLAIERRIRDAAIEAFIESGFEGTTMEAVATAARTTRRTLYAKHPDKQALFAAVIPQALADMPFHGAAIEVPGGDLREALRHVALQIIERLVDPTAVRLRRLAIFEAQRIAALDPVEGADLLSASLQVVVDLLESHAERGAIVAEDLGTAADLFLAMTASSPTVWADFGVLRPAADVEAHVDGAIDLFLNGMLPRDPKAGSR